MSEAVVALAPRVLAGDLQAAARLMRALDDGLPGATLALQAIYPSTGKAFVLGITGTPGAGKSTLVDAVVARLRADGQRVGVVAVDPSSPFSGGAILGDRIRMQRHALDPGVFIRSLATRGHLGGLSRSTGDTINVLDAAGFEVVIVETVGVGQDEVDVVRVADTTVVVSVPGMGDDVQALKHGILEIADVLVVNKADREGADRTARDLRNMLSLRTNGPQDLDIVLTVATRGDGLPELMEAISGHRQRQQDSGGFAQRRRAQAESQLRAVITDRLRRQAEGELARLGGIARLAEEVASRRRDPYSVAEEITAPTEK